MSPSLNALMKKLTWQKNDLSMQLKLLEEQTQAMKQALLELEHTLTQASNTQLIINPELEINRLHFITHHHEEKEHLACSLKNQTHQELQLKDKIRRVNTELKVLEQYTQREQLKAEQALQKKAQHSLDEWVIQQRGSA